MCEVIRKAAVACPAGREFPVYFLVVETQKKGRGMHFTNSIFVQLLKPINRKQFKTIVERHDGDAYDKSFKSWEHLITLLFAQLTCAESLRGLAETWNANPQHHYHLGTHIRLKRSTLADANERRPVAVFADVFSLVAGQLDARTRREGKEMVRLIDSTPIPLGKLCDWAKSNGRIRGMKMHVVYDPKADCPRVLDITDANVNTRKSVARPPWRPAPPMSSTRAIATTVGGAPSTRPRRSSSPGQRSTWASLWSKSARSRMPKAMASRFWQMPR
jgi:putative transposase